MTELTKRVTRQPVEVSRVRLTVLMLASLIAPVVLFIESFRFRGGDLSVIAVFSAFIYLLVLSRLSDVAASHGRALGRERVVRQAGASLVSAITVEQAGAAVRSATDALFGRGPRGDVLLAVRTDGTVRAVATASADPAPMSRRTDLAEGWLPLVTGSAPILAPVTSLPPLAAAIVPGYDWMLLCPLTLNDRPAGDPLIGALAVFGEQRTLADLAATLEILAQEVALAVDRIMLREEVTRQGNEAYFRTLVQDTSEVILIVDDDGKVRYATPSAAGIFGDIAVEGADPRDLVADGSGDELAGAGSRASATSGVSSRYMNRQITRRDGMAVQVQVRASDLRADPTVAGRVLTLRDVTEQRQLEEQLKYQAFHDALTGLPNRLFFAERVSQQAAPDRLNGAKTAPLSSSTLDDFKVVNGTMGHGVGDELLVATAVRLFGLIRECDTAARLGGDEFALLITGAPDSAAVEAAAERIVRAFAEPLVLASGAVLTTVTVGVATTEDGIGTDELLRHADLALYAAKAAGKRQLAPLPARAERRAGQAAGAAGRTGESGGPLRLHARLPADRHSRHWRAGRVRGTGPVAASAVGDDAARPVHCPGRRDRPDRAARLLGTGPGGRRHCVVAPGSARRSTPGPGLRRRVSHSRSVREREHVGPAVPHPRFRRQRAPDPGLVGLRARGTHAL